MASSGSIATTLNPTRETLTSSQLLTASVSSLSSPTRQSSSQISKIYRQSSQLFLTRRLPESLSTILPLITPPASDDTNAGAEPAPISKASRTTRIKVWSLYLTILNAVVELDPDEGKQAFGSHEWRGLVTMVRDGDVWEEVVKHGYGGAEGDVDSDVVINLATLLLAHARTQKVNQQRLENYLAASTTPNLDIADRLEASQSHHRRGPSTTKSNAGTDTPRDLNARVKILELYTLHVLLRNNEWDYAREFISISSVLDEERREAFLQALQSLQDEQNEVEKREREEKRYEDEMLKRDIEEARRRREAEEREQERRRLEDERDKGKGKASSETDYGVEDALPSGTSSKARSVKDRSTKGDNDRRKNVTSPTARSSAPGVRKGTLPILMTRAANILASLRNLLDSMATSFKTNPMILLRTLAFIVGILTIVARKDVRERIKRITGQGWQKIRQTAGMGVKVGVENAMPFKMLFRSQAQYNVWHSTINAFRILMNKAIQGYTNKLSS